MGSNKDIVVVDLASSPPIDKKLLGREIIRVSAEDLAAGAKHVKPGSVAIMLVLNTPATIKAVVKEAERLLKKMDSLLIVVDVTKAWEGRGHKSDEEVCEAWQAAIDGYQLKNKDYYLPQMADTGATEKRRGFKLECHNSSRSDEYLMMQAETKKSD